MPLEPIDVDPAQAPYSFVDYERRAPLLWLALGFFALVALLGRRVGALLLTALLASALTAAAHITGRSSEEATLLQSVGEGRNPLGGLVLAGILIAALGVLHDVTIGQASTVLALRRANRCRASTTRRPTSAPRGGRRIRERSRTAGLARGRGR